MKNKKIIAILLSLGMFVSSCCPVYAAVLYQEEKTVSNDIAQSAIMEDSTINSDISDISDSSLQDDFITEEKTNDKTDESVSEKSTDDSIDVVPEDDSYNDTELLTDDEDIQEEVVGDSQTSGDWKGLHWEIYDSTLEIYENGQSKEYKTDYNVIFNHFKDIYPDYSFFTLYDAYQVLWKTCPWCLQNTNHISNISNIKNVYIHDVEDISGFVNYPNLTTVQIGKNVQKIGSFAFWNCNLLKSVSVSDESSLKFIDTWAFNNCVSLVTCTLPNTIQNDFEITYDSFETILPEQEITYGMYIGSGAFIGCNKLDLQSLPDSVIYIGDTAFRDCSALSISEIPEQVQVIGDSAFAFSGIGGEQGILTLHSTHLSFGEYAFYNCKKLQSVLAKDCILYVCPYTFADCSSLKNITCNRIYKYDVDNRNISAFENDTNLLDIITDPDLYGVKCGLWDYDVNDDDYSIHFSDFKDTQIRVVCGPTKTTVANTMNGINVQWNKSLPPTDLKDGFDDTKVEYKIYRAERTVDKDFFTSPKLIATTKTLSYLDKNVKAGVEYSYDVTAIYNKKYESPFNDSRLIIRLTSPTITSVSSANNSFTVKWNKMSGVKGYKLFYTTDPAFKENVTKVVYSDPNKVQATIKNLNKGTTYYIRLQTYVKNSYGQYSYSGNSYKKSIKITGLDTPTISSVSSANNSITVKWKKMSGIKGYKIFYSTDSAFAKDIKQVVCSDINTVQTTIKNLTKGKKYYVRIQTYKKVNNVCYYSGYSTTKSITIK